MTASLHALEIGMEWTPDGSGTGVGRMFDGLVRHLPSSGVHVHPLATAPPQASAALAPVDPPSDLTSEPAPPNNTVQFFAPSTASMFQRLAALRSALRRAIADQPIDVMASHFALYTLPALTLPGAPPLVIHFHGPWALESEAEGESAAKIAVKSWVERLVYRQGVRFIVLSTAFRDLLASEYDVPLSRINIVPGGVDTARFDTGLSRVSARERLDLPTTRPIILSVRRLVQRVGLIKLLEAMPSVKQALPHVLLLIAGKGPLRHKIERHIRTLELEDSVRLLGFVPDNELPVAYRAADLSVMPTQSLEGFGLSAVESLAAGTPVLATPVGGLPEIVADLSPDLTFPNCTATAMSQHLIDALNGQLDLPDGERCMRHAKAHYDWPVIAEQVRSVYQEVA